MNSDEKQTVASYNNTASIYAEKVKNFHPAKEAAYFLNHIPTCGSILDVGCGTGRDVKIFSDREYYVLGIDPADEMIRLARATAPYMDFSVSGIEEFDSNGYLFDGVWASASLLHLPKKKLPDAISNIYDATKDGGIFYSSFIEGDFEGLKESRAYPGEKKFWAYHWGSELEDMLTDSGFKILKIDSSKPDTEYHRNHKNPGNWLSIFCKK